MSATFACDSAPPTEVDAGIRPEPLPIILDAGAPADSGIVHASDAGPDGGSVNLDAGVVVDAGKRSPVGPPNGHNPSAAGSASSSEHRAQFSIGAPLPRGTAQSTNHTLRLTPQPGPVTP